VQLAGARAALIAARNERDRTRLDLTRALGLPLEASVRPSDSLAALSAADTVGEAEAVRRALAARPDLRAAGAQIEAVHQQERAIRAERLPTVGAFVDQGTLGKRTDVLKSTYTWGIQASLPLFEGFRREGRMSEQEAIARELEVRRRDLEAQTAVEVHGALLDLRSAREQTEAAGERLRLAEQEVAQARDRFRAGVSGNADVITASLSLNAARTAYVDALAATQSARVALARAQGLVTELP
jgi:outer membrane protein